MTCYGKLYVSIETIVVYFEMMSNMME